MLRKKAKCSSEHIWCMRLAVMRVHYKSNAARVIKFGCEISLNHIFECPLFCSNQNLTVRKNRLFAAKKIKKKKSFSFGSKATTTTTTNKKFH